MTAAAARRSTRTSARSARRSCRSAATATTSAFLGLPRKLNLDAADLERRFRALSRQFHPGLLLQRDAGRAPRQPRALVVPERRLPHAEASGLAHRVPAELEGLAPRVRRRRPSRCRRRCSRKCSRSTRSSTRSASCARAARRRPSGSARLERRAAADRSQARRARAQLQELAAQWDARGDAARGRPTRTCSKALRERLLERNYINNLLAGIERRV